MKWNIGLRSELAFRLLEVEALVMNARAMLGQDNLKEFLIKCLEAEVKLNQINEEIRIKPETEYFLAADVEQGK